MKKIFVFILLLSCLQVMAQNSSVDKYFQQAESYFKSGNYDQALKSLNAFVRALDGDDISDDMAKVGVLRNKIIVCQNIYLKADSCYYAKLDSCSMGKQYAEALTLYETLKQFNPAHPDLDSKIEICRLATTIYSKLKDQNNPNHSVQNGNQSTGFVKESSTNEEKYHRGYGQASSTQIIYIKR